jgi:hypothetical protein
MPYYPSISNVGGTGSALNIVTCTVNFGHPDGGSTDVSDVVTVEASWVTADTLLSCYIVSADSTGNLYNSTDHDFDDIIVEGINVNVFNVVPGVGFDVQAYAANNSWGRYVVNIIGQ